MRANHEIRAGWVQLILDQGGTHAVTLAYNTRYGGTAFPCTRISATGKRLQISASRDADQLGSYRLPTVRYVPLEEVHRDIRHLHALIEGRWFGRRYHRVQPEKRGSYVGFTENEQANIHVHLSWRVPAQWGSSFSALVETAWKKMKPFGSCHVDTITDDGWARYITKKLSNEEAAAFVSSGI